MFEKMKSIHHICYDGLILFHIDFVLIRYYFSDTLVSFKERRSAKNYIRVFTINRNFTQFQKKKYLNEKN